MPGWTLTETIGWIPTSTMGASYISTKFTNFVAHALMLIYCLHQQDTESGLLLKTEELPDSAWAVLALGLSYTPVSCAETGPLAALPCFPGGFSLANLVQEFSTFTFLKQGLESYTPYSLKHLKSFCKLISHLSDTQSCMTKTIKLYPLIFP